MATLIGGTGTDGGSLYLIYRLTRKWVDVFLQ